MKRSEMTEDQWDAYCSYESHQSYLADKAYEEVYNKE